MDIAHLLTEPKIAVTPQWLLNQLQIHLGANSSFQLQDTRHWKFCKLICWDQYTLCVWNSPIHQATNPIQKGSQFTLAVFLFSEHGCYGTPLLLLHVHKAQALSFSALPLHILETYTLLSLPKFIHFFPLNNDLWLTSDLLRVFPIYHICRWHRKILP